MTEVTGNHHRDQTCSPSCSHHHHVSDIDCVLKSDQNSTASTSSITSASPDSPSSSLVYPATNSHVQSKIKENRRESQRESISVKKDHITSRAVVITQKTKTSQVISGGSSTVKLQLVRPKAQVLQGQTNSNLGNTSTGARVLNCSGISESTVDTKGLNHSPGSAKSSTPKTVQSEGIKTVAPIPIVVRPAPLKKNLSVTVKNSTNSLPSRNKAVEAQSQQQNEEQRNQLLRQRQQIQQQEVAERRKQHLIRKKKQQDQCNFPNPTTSDNNVVSNNYLHFRAANNRTNYTMGSKSNQHVSQVQVMSQPQQGYVVEKQLLVHNHNLNNSNDVLESTNPTPLFERMVTEEAQDMKRMVDSLTRRIAEMQTAQNDLESRLEKSTKETLEKESQLENLNRNWVKKCSDLEEERDTWAKRCSVERGRNERLSDLVNRKDKEIQRMIQRKYDSTKSHGHSHSNHMKRSESARAASNQQAQAKKNTSKMQGMSPYEYCVQRGSSDAIRARNALNSLLDFFGM